MSESVHHCPFLNRADHRCSEHFSLDQLGHAYKFCFDRYSKCPVYAEMLAERHVKQVSLATHANRESADSIAETTMRIAHARNPFVQVTFRGKVDREGTDQPTQSAA